MIKLPKDFIAAGYEFDAAIPSAKFETARTPEGSFVFRAGYGMNEIEEFTRQFAHEMNKKVEAAIMDELLRLNGYVPERTCTFSECWGDDPLPTCSACGWKAEEEDCVFGSDMKIKYYGKFCKECGAKVVE